jgi:hypothetical protein
LRQRRRCRAQHDARNNDPQPAHQYLRQSSSRSTQRRR